VGHRKRSSRKPVEHTVNVTMRPDVINASNGGQYEELVA
jgi:hypothetical protein